MADSIGGQRRRHGEGAAGGDQVLDVDAGAGVAGQLEDLGDGVGVGAAGARRRCSGRARTPARRTSAATWAKVRSSS